jgi:hypothetical protein
VVAANCSLGKIQSIMQPDQRKVDDEKNRYGGDPFGDACTIDRHGITVQPASRMFAIETLFSPGAQRGAVNGQPEHDY